MFCGLLKVVVLRFGSTVVVSKAPEETRVLVQDPTSCFMCVEAVPTNFGDSEAIRQALNTQIAKTQAQDTLNDST